MQKHGFLACVVWYRVLLLNPEQNCLLPAFHVDLDVECEATWEDELKHNITITSDHSKHHLVDWLFGFHQYEYVFRLTHKYWILHIGTSRMNANQHSMLFLNFYRNKLSWCFFPYRQCSTDSSLLYSRQNQKQIKHMYKNQSFKMVTIYPSQSIYIYSWIQNHFRNTNKLYNVSTIHKHRYTMTQNETKKKFVAYQMSKTN